MPMPTAQVDGMTPMTQPVDPVVARDVDRSLHEEAESVCRDGINLARYAIKLRSLATDREHERQALETALIETLGEEALRYVRRNRPVAS